MINYKKVTVTEEELSDYIESLDVEHNTDASDALNWLLTINNPGLQTEKVLRLLIDGTYSINDLINCYKNKEDMTDYPEFIEHLWTEASLNIRRAIYTEIITKMKKVLNTRTFEKFFKYIARRYKDPSVFVKNDDIVYYKENKETMSDSNKYALYAKILSTYNERYMESSLSNSTEAFRNAANAFVLHVNNIFDESPVESLEIEMEKIGLVSWVKTGEAAIKSTCPLITDFISESLDIKIFANDVVIGFILRGMYEENYVYNADEVHDLLYYAIEYALSKLTDSSFTAIEEAIKNKESLLDCEITIEKEIPAAGSTNPEEKIKVEVKMTLSELILQFFTVDNMFVKNFRTSGYNGINVMTGDRVEIYENLFPENLCNRSFIHRLFYTEFAGLESIVAMELAIIPTLADSANLEVATDSAVLIRSLDNLLISMSLVSKELINYTDFIIDIINTNTQVE